jgi:hypothetical protein
MAVDRFEAELKSKYKDEREFWNDYFKARDEYYIEKE